MSLLVYMMDCMMHDRIKRMTGAQVHAGYDANSEAQLEVADAPLLMPTTAEEAAALRLPMPKNMVQAVRIAPLLSNAAGAAQQVRGWRAAALRMVVTVPSRFCGVSVNQAGPLSPAWECACVTCRTATGCHEAARFPVGRAGSLVHQCRC